jgi:hypothetical protein
MSASLWLSTLLLLLLGAGCSAPDQTSGTSDNISAAPATSNLCQTACTVCGLPSQSPLGAACFCLASSGTVVVYAGALCHTQSTDCQLTDSGNIGDPCYCQRTCDGRPEDGVRIALAVPKPRPRTRP